MSNRLYILAITAAISITVLFIGKTAMPADPPHPTGCSICHNLHNSPGTALTNCGGNYSPDNAKCVENLCISCHNAAGSASGKTFSNPMSAIPGERGSSHAWNGTMPLTSSPSNKYGLRAVADIQNIQLRQRLELFNGVTNCSVCHDQHSHIRIPWDPSSSQTYTRGVTNNRRFQRMDNQYNQMCYDCHYYRAMGYVMAKGDDPGYVPDGIKQFSHPVSELLNSTGYDYDAPLGANGVKQTNAPRYDTDSDGVSKNEMVLDNTGRVRCLSCHRMHYVYSNTLRDNIP